MNLRKNLSNLNDDDVFISTPTNKDYLDFNVLMLMHQEI